MKDFIKNIWQRKILLLAAVIIIAAAGYWIFQKFFASQSAARYITAEVQRGTLVSSVSGSGQVSVSNQIDLKPRVSGNVVYVGPDQGQAVGAGALIAKLDSTDAEKTVRDAQVNLDNAQINLEKLRGPDASATVPRNKTDALASLKQAYDDGFNNVANAFLDLPTIITGLNSVLYGTDFNPGQSNINYYNDATKPYNADVATYFASAGADFQTGQNAYNKNFTDYKNSSRSGSQESINALIDETYLTAEDVSQALKSASNLIQFYEDQLTAQNKKHAALADTHLATLNTYIGKINTDLTNLLGSQNSINADQNAVANADLDIKSQELAILQQQNALTDAKANLDYYSIRAPFVGIVATINVKVGDPVSPSTVISTFITHQKTAEISLNEVDAAKAKVGQKATLTFDAIPDLTIAGEVAQIDTLGTIAQGVVTYNVKIVFDTQDERVKPGMSVSAAIVTDVRQNALAVPNSAIKQQNNSSYVEIFTGTAESPRQQAVETGVSNDTMTEILSGVNEGDRVVTQTITSSAASGQAAQNAGLRIPGITGGGPRGGAGGR